MAITSEIDICNAALALVGEPQIVSFAATTEAERQCELLYGISRDTVLRSHPWNFAEKYEALAMLTETPAAEFSYFFQLPLDCIRALKMVDSQSNWRIMAGRKLATDDTTVNLLYTAQITDVGNFDPLFAQSVIYHLAAQLSIILPNKANLHGQFMTMYETILRNAKVADGQEGTPTTVTYKNDWTSYRSTKGAFWPWRWP